MPRGDPTCQMFPFGVCAFCAAGCGFACIVMSWNYGAADSRVFFSSFFLVVVGELLLPKCMTTSPSLCVAWRVVVVVGVEEVRLTPPVVFLAVVLVAVLVASGGNNCRVGGA